MMLPDGVRLGVQSFKMLRFARNFPSPDCRRLTCPKSLLETVKNSEVRAQRDNDLIYHQDVPSPAALSKLQETKLVSATVPKGLLNSSSIIGTRHRLFSELAGWGPREAISQYFFSP